MHSMIFLLGLKKTTNKLIILFYNALLCEEPCSRIQVVRLENFSGQTKINIFLPGLVLDCFCSVVPHTEYVIEYELSSAIVKVVLHHFYVPSYIAK